MSEEDTHFQQQNYIKNPFKDKSINYKLHTVCRNPSPLSLREKITQVAHSGGAGSKYEVAMHGVHWQPDSQRNPTQ